MLIRSRRTPWHEGYTDEFLMNSWPIRYRVARLFRRLSATMYAKGRKDAKRYMEVGHDNAH